MRLRMSLFLCLCHKCELSYAYVYVYAYAYAYVTSVNQPLMHLFPLHLRSTSSAIRWDIKI